MRCASGRHSDQFRVSEYVGRIEIGTGLFLLSLCNSFAVGVAFVEIGAGEESRMKGLVTMTSLVAVFIMGQCVPILQSPKSALLLWSIISFSVVEYRGTTTLQAAPESGRYSEPRETNVSPVIRGQATSLHACRGTH